MKQQGRAALVITNDLERLYEVAMCIVEIQLGVTVRPVEQAAREQACEVIFKWIDKHLAVERFRLVFCKALCSSYTADFVNQLCSGDEEARNALAQLMNSLHLESSLLFLDAFIVFDLKLWKGFRLLLHKNYIATLLVHTTYKKIFGMLPLVPPS